MKQNQTTTASSTGEVQGSSVHAAWRNWFMLAGVLFLTAVGLIIAIRPLLERKAGYTWPWMKTDLALLGGLAIVLFLFVVYLSYQQRRIMRMHRNIEMLKMELAEKIDLHINRLSALSQISHIIAVETELFVILDKITQTCMEKFDSSRATLMLYDQLEGELVVKAVRGSFSEDIRDARQPIDKGIAGWVARNKIPLLLNGPEDIASYPELQMQDSSISSAIVVPIIVRNELVGVLNVSKLDSPGSFELEDLYVLQIFANTAGSCIRHAEQINWMRHLIPQLETPGDSAR